METGVAFSIEEAMQTVVGVGVGDDSKDVGPKKTHPNLVGAARRGVPVVPSSQRK